MADRELLTSGMFESTYEVDVWLISHCDIVHRKNADFALEAIDKSGFSHDAIELITTLPECSKQILGEVELSSPTPTNFTMKFLETNCHHHVNYHDNKMCTVELVVKFSSTLDRVLCLADNLLESLHLEIKTPVGNIQV